MIVQVIKPFREFIENQIIDTHKYGLASTYMDITFPQQLDVEIAYVA